ncbi:MAG: CDGSH iron-sulfur domain-containing protein [Haloferacaceae archaeon]
MARLVVHDATEPRKLTAADVDPEKGDIAVCRCGLSAERPFCDGTHRLTGDEGEGEGCFYYEPTDDGPRRREVDRIVFADGTERSFGGPESEG